MSFSFPLNAYFAFVVYINISNRIERTEQEAREYVKCYKFMQFIIKVLFK